MLKFLFIYLFFISCTSDKLEDSSPQELEQMRLKTVYGDIIIKLHTEEAPLTTARIKQLINSGFYTGLKFHKVITNFIIQTGDPTNTGNGGSGEHLKDEDNNMKHIQGSVAIVKQQNRVNTADSQFYICLGDCSSLDGKYTIFGSVTSGIAIAKKIQLNDRIIDISID